MRFILLLAFVLVSGISKAQEVTVLDEEEGYPIFNVAVFNKNKTISRLTNFDGKVNISAFGPNEVIYFRHVSHKEYHATKRQILQRKNRIYLEKGENQLNEVVLSVSKFEQNKKDIPQKVISIDRKDIITSSPQTSADLLESTGQIYVQKSQLGGGSPMIRGFSTNRLLIAVDGVRMNTAIFRGGNVQNVISIDPLSIERTEVVLGPGSVIYGSDAIGGVMNFYTLTPGFSMAKGGAFSARAYTRYATANEEKTGHVDFSFGKEKWATVTSVTYSDFDDLRMGSNGPEEYLRHEYVVRRDGQDIIVENENPLVQTPTGYEQINLLQKVRFRPNREWDFNLGLIYSATTNFPRYDRLYRKRDGMLRSAEWYYGPQRWLQTNLQVEKTGNGVLYDDLKLTTAYQFFEESRNDRDFGQPTLFQTEEQVNAWSANLDFEKNFVESTFFYGAEYVLNEIGSRGTETDIHMGTVLPSASRYPDGASWESLAAYGSYEWKPKDDLTLQGGLRYNHIILQAEFDEDIYDFPFSDANLNTGALTGSLGLNWQQNTVLGWQVLVSTGFRAPNVDDVGKIFDSAPGMVVVPNPDLKPEKAYNAEIGANINVEKVLQLELTAYYTHLENALVRRDFSLDGQEYIDYRGEPSRVLAIQNAAVAYVYGFEAGARLRFSDNLRFVGHINLTEGKEEQDDGTEAALRHAAPLFGNAHLIWENDKWRFDLFTDYNGEVAYEDLAPGEQDKAYLYAVDENGNPYAPKWYTLNFGTQFQVNESWLASASLENITDQRYRTYSSGLSAAGRNLILALQYTF